MKNRTISHRQMMAVVLLAILPLGTEVLFQRLASAGPAGWLCPLLAGGAAALAAQLAGRRKRKGVPEGRLHRGLSGVLLLWGVFFGAAQACRIGVRLSDSLGASPVVMTGLLLALASWMAFGGLPAFARACEVFLLAVGGAYALILLGGVFRLRWDWVLLWSGENLQRVPLGGMETLGLLAIGCYGLVLLEDVTEEEGRRRRTIQMIGKASVLLAAGGILILGRFGGALTGRMARPFFQMVSGLGLEGAFQRLEQLISALWVLGDLALLGLLLLALVRLTAQTSGRQERPGWAWLWGSVLFLLALPVGLWKVVLTGPVLWAGNLLAGGLLVAQFCPKKKNEKI